MVDWLRGMASAATRANARRTLWLALPLIAGNLSGVGMNFVDTVMAGRLGAVALGAVAIGGAVWSAVFLFVLGTLLSIQPEVSRLNGAGRNAAVGSLARQGLWLGLGLAALMFVLLRSAGPLLVSIGIDAEVRPVALAYLDAISWGAPALCGVLALRFFSEGTERTRPTMYIGAFGVLVNIPLDYALVFGKLGLPQMGAVGCGWATTLVFWLQLTALVAWLKWRPEYRAYRPFAHFEWPDRRRLAELLRIGLPIGGMIFIEGSMFVGAALLIGSLGATAIAGHQVAINFAALAFMVPLGLAGAITVRVGNALGRGEPLAARSVGQVGIALTVITQTVSALLMLLAPRWIASWYTSDPAVIEVAAMLLRLGAVFQLSDGIQAAAAGALRGYQETRIPMLLTMLAYWGIGMPVGWLLTFAVGLGAPGMWFGMIGGLTAAAITLTARFHRISRRAQAPAVAS